jgi:O-antigen ligase
VPGATAVAACIAVGLNAYEWFYPLTFSDSYGRAAGLYINPNISGAALVVLMTIGVQAVPGKLREWFAAAAGLGVFLTFSRGALIGWALAVVVLLVTGMLGRRRFALVATVSVLALMTLATQSRSIDDALHELTSVRPELTSRAVQFHRDDVNVDGRLVVAREAWVMFALHPVFGSGLAATTEWRLPSGTHDTYLMHLAEHGILGVFLLPVLLVLLWKAGYDADSPGALALVVFLATWGIFSHNMLEEFYVLVAIAWVAAIGVTAQRAFAAVPQTSPTAAARPVLRTSITWP